MRILATAAMALALTACGGSNGDSGSALVEAVLSSVNAVTSATLDHSSVVSPNSKGSSHGCTEAHTTTRDQIRSFAEYETDHALCGREDDSVDEDITCIYPSGDNFRVEAEYSNPGDPDGTENRVLVAVQGGLSEFAVFDVESVYEYEASASNINSSCDIEAAQTAYSSDDINKSFEAVAIAIDSNGVPEELSEGTLTCGSGSCGGIALLSDLVFDNDIEGWTGSMNFDGAQYDFIANLSPNKKILTVAGCPFGAVAPSELFESCIVIAGYSPQ